MPSRRGARPARPVSCVATMIVVPCSAPRRVRISMISAPVPVVEVARRLVREDHPRLERQRACDRDPLLLSAREVRREVARAVGEADLGEHALGALPGVDRRESGRGELRLDVLEGGQRRDQVELLEDESERAQPELGEVAVAQLREIATLEEDAAAGRTVERAEELEERRLSRSRSALRARRTDRARSSGRRPGPR